MEFTPVTAETVSQMIGDCFPIEREVDLATFTDSTTFRTKSLQATIYGHWDGENYQLDGVTYTVTTEGETTEEFDDRTAAIEFYNALDLSEPLPDEYPTMTSPLPGGIPGKMTHYAPIKFRVTGASGSSVLGEEE